MTVRVIALMARRAGMSRDEFIAYYRDNHAPLIEEMTGLMSAYERNFVVHSDIIYGEGAPEVDFDVVTIIDYPDEETYAEAQRRQSTGENGKARSEDEDKLFDRSKLRYFRVDIQTSELPERT